MSPQIKIVRRRTINLHYYGLFNGSFYSFKVWPFSTNPINGPRHGRSRQRWGGFIKSGPFDFFNNWYYC